jgi:uncharacterized protein (PEP-CTERM system associated)
LFPSEGLAQVVGTLTQPANLPRPPTFAAAASPPAAPATLTLPSFLLTGALDFSEGFTTNAGGLEGSQTNKADGFTRGSLSLGLHYDSPRLRADANYALTGYYYNHFHNLDQWNQRLNLTSTSELISDHLFFNFNGFAAPTTLSRVGPLSPNQDFTDINNRQSYGYSATPVYKMRFGDYAISETSLSLSQLFFVSPSPLDPGTSLPITPVDNTTSTTVTERISSGPHFGRLKWDTAISYANVDQTAQSTRQGEIIANLAYALNRTVALLATTGYDQFDSSVPLTQSVSGPIALGGIQLSGPSLSLFALAGVRYGFATFLGSANWQPTPTFKVIGSLTDGVSTPQSNVLGDLSTLGISAQGAFADAQSGYWETGEQALFPQFATVSPVSTDGLALDNTINRERRAQLAFIHEDERNQYGLSFFGNMRDRLNVTTDTTPSKSWLYGVRINASRKLRRNLVGYAAVSYSYANEFGGRDRILETDAGLTYALNENVDCYLTGRYLNRTSHGQDVADLPLSEFTASIGIRRRF